MRKPIDIQTTGVWPSRRKRLARWAMRGVTVKEMAKRFGCNRRHVRKAIAAFGILQKRWNWKGKNNPAWRGGKTLSHGYVMVYAPDHPHRDRHNKVQKHRLVMEKKIGRLLKPLERVHHRDDNRQNNRPGNLHLYPSNAAHLADTLKGRRPKWTTEGRKRMREAAEKRRKCHRQPQAGRPASTPTH